MTADDAPGRRAIVLLSIALAACVVLTYLPAIFAGFIWDDDKYLLENSTLLELNGLLRIWTTMDCPQYYPLTFTTFWMEHKLWGFHPLGYHLSNILLHAASSILLFRVLTRLRVPAAWLAAAVFAMHPVNVQSVAWITERKNVLSMFLVLAAWFLYEYWQQVARHRYYVASLAAFMLAMFSKTTACVLPVALVLTDWARFRPMTRRRLSGYLPYFFIGLALSAVTVLFEIVRVNARGEEWSLPWSERIVRAGGAFWYYVTKLLWPTNLCFVYRQWPIEARSWTAYLPATAVVALLLLAWALRRHWGRLPTAALLYFSAALFPALGFINVYPLRYMHVADHFPYLATLGFIPWVVCGLAWFVQRALRRFNPAISRRLPIFAAASMLVVLALQTFIRAGDFHDEETLWRDTIAKNQDAWMAHSNLSVLLLRQQRSEEALLHAGQAAHLAPHAFETWTNYGLALGAVGRWGEAEQCFQKALHLAPHSPSVWFNLGAAHDRLGNPARAAECFTRGLELDPTDVRARVRLVESLVDAGRFQDAVEHLDALKNSKEVQENVKLRARIEQLRSRLNDPSSR